MTDADLTAASTATDHGVVVELIAEASARFVAEVVDLRPEHWAQPGLGEWDVRQLVGHTLRAFSTVDRFLDNPVSQVGCATTADYYRIALTSAPDIHEQVAARGREAGEALGDDPVTSVVEQVSAVLGRLAETTGDEIGLTAAGGMSLTDYLDTRLVELVVHLSDLCAAVGAAPPDLGAAGVRAASTIFASASTVDRDATLRAMLGRAPLPAGFSVWP